MVISPVFSNIALVWVKSSGYLRENARIKVLRWNPSIPNARIKSYYENVWGIHCHTIKSCKVLEKLFYALPPTAKNWRRGSWNKWTMIIVLIVERTSLLSTLCVTKINCKLFFALHCTYIGIILLLLLICSLMIFGFNNIIIMLTVNQ